MRKIVFHADLLSRVYSVEDFSGYWSKGTPEELDKAADEWATQEANRLSENSGHQGYRVSKVWITIEPEQE